MPNISISYLFQYRLKCIVPDIQHYNQLPGCNPMICTEEFFISFVIIESSRMGIFSHITVDTRERYKLPPTRARSTSLSKKVKKKKKSYY